MRYALGMVVVGMMLLNGCDKEVDLASQGDTAGKIACKAQVVVEGAMEHSGAITDKLVISTTGAVTQSEIDTARSMVFENGREIVDKTVTELAGGQMVRDCNDFGRVIASAGGEVFKMAR